MDSSAPAANLEDLIRKDSAKTSNVNVTTADSDEAAGQLNNALAFDSGKFSSRGEKNTRRPSETIDNLSSALDDGQADMGQDGEMKSLSCFRNSNH